MCGGQWPAMEQCGECAGTGVWALTSCPMDVIGRGRAVEVMRMTRFAGEGSWPVSGGVLDQSQWFIDAMDVVESEQSFYLQKQHQKP